MLKGRSDKQANGTWLSAARLRPWTWLPSSVQLLPFAQPSRTFLNCESAGKPAKLATSRCGCFSSWRAAWRSGSFMAFLKPTTWIENPRALNEKTCNAHS